MLREAESREQDQFINVAKDRIFEKVTLSKYWKEVRECIKRVSDGKCFLAEGRGD